MRLETCNCVPPDVLPSRMLESGPEEFLGQVTSRVARCHTDQVARHQNLQHAFQHLQTYTLSRIFQSRTIDCGDFCSLESDTLSFALVLYMKLNQRVWMLPFAIRAPNQNNRDHRS